MTQVGRKNIQERNAFNKKKRSDEKWGIMYSSKKCDFHSLVGCLVGLLRRGKKRISYVIYICILKFVPSLKSDLCVFTQP